MNRTRNKGQVLLTRHYKMCEISSVLENEPTPEKLALFVLRKLILKMRMRSHPVGLDLWIFVGPLVYFHTVCERTAKAVTRLRGCLCDKYHNLMSWLK